MKLDAEFIAEQVTELCDSSKIFHPRVGQGICFALLKGAEKSKVECNLDDGYLQQRFCQLLLCRVYGMDEVEGSERIFSDEQISIIADTPTLASQWGYTLRSVFTKLPDLLDGSDDGKQIHMVFFSSAVAVTDILYLESQEVGL